MMQPNADVFDIFRALMRLRRAWHPVRPSPMMSKSHFTTLMAIAHAGDEDHPDYVPVKIVGGGLAVSDLSLLLKQSLSVTSQRIKALEELELVGRFNDEIDRRVVRVRLTDKGQIEVEKAHIAMKKRIDDTMIIFGHDRIPVLIEMLDRLADAFEKTGEAESLNHIGHS